MGFALQTDLDAAQLPGSCSENKTNKPYSLLSQLPDQVKARFATSFSGTNAEIFYPGNPGYNELIVRFSETCEKQAAAVILPTSPEDIAKAVVVSRGSGLPLVVAGGRHNPSGCSAIQNGVVIDLRKMRRVTVDSNALTVTAEGGCVWGDVDTETSKFGLAAVGGTVSHVGVGGLTLGGGYGWLSGRHGLTLDNLLSVKMVLSDGRILNTSKDCNQDLFWAVRGAGQCFGVAAEFVYRAYPQGDVWGGTLVFTPDKLPDVVDFVNWMHEHLDGDQGMAFGFSTPPGVKFVAVMAAVFFNGKEEDAVAYFKPLLDLEPVVNDTKAMPFGRLNTMLDDGMRYGGRKNFGGSNITMPLDSAFFQSVYDEMSKFVSNHDGTEESLILIELIPYKKMLEVAVDETACANRGEYYNVGSLMQWRNPQLDAEVVQFNRKLHDRITEQAGTKSSTGVGIYPNYLHVSRTPEEMFGTTTARLKELKMKYDPKNLFRSWHDLLPD